MNDQSSVPSLSATPDSPLWAHQILLLAALEEEDSRFAAGRRLLVRVATGGGKRRIFNDFIVNQVIPSGRRVLVVTKDWFLLGQAADDLLQRHPDAQHHLGYVGDGGRTFMPTVAQTGRSAVVYTTIQTWVSRANKDFKDDFFDYVIIDELHWGEGAPSYDLLLNRYAATSVFLGFTATPRQWSSFQLVGRAFDFEDLVGAQILAQPVIFEATNTGVNWAPERSSEHGDFTQPSLNQLAVNDARNTKIVETYLEHRRAFGQTVVFACNIAHAKMLAALFDARDVRAEAVYSKLKTSECQRILRTFRDGDLDVVVNVGMLTHGVDIPSIKTVFLARPTTSDILFSQMIGRGSRLAPGKRHFNIVDFVDNVPTHGVPPIRPDGFFGTQRLYRSPALERHEFAAAEFTAFPLLPGYEALAGLDVHPTQTFGIEFELAPLRRPFAYQAKACCLLEVLRKVVPTASEPCAEAKSGKDNRVWNIEPDASCGLEITSRILVGERGFMEVMDACRAIEIAARELGLVVTAKTGTHVHLGWSPDFASLRRLMEISAFYEPALLSLVAPSRAGNKFASSVRKSLGKLLRLPTMSEWRRHLVDGGRRYLAVNPSQLFGGYGTVEIRMHSGTIEAPKILTWLSLWMRIHEAAANTDLPIGNALRRVKSRPLCCGPRGDVGALAAFAGSNEVSREKLLQRRDYVVSNSWAFHPEFGDLARRLLEEWPRPIGSVLPSRSVEESSDAAVA